MRRVGLAIAVFVLAASCSEPPPAMAPARGHEGQGQVHPRAGLAHPAIEADPIAPAPGAAKAVPAPPPAIAAGAPTAPAPGQPCPTLSERLARLQANGFPAAHFFRPVAPATPIMSGTAADQFVAAFAAATGISHAEADQVAVITDPKDWGRDRFIVVFAHNGCADGVEHLDLSQTLD